MRATEHVCVHMCIHVVRVCIHVLRACLHTCDTRKHDACNV